MRFTAAAALLLSGASAPPPATASAGAGGRQASSRRAAPQSPSAARAQLAEGSSLCEATAGSRRTATAEADDRIDMLTPGVEKDSSDAEQLKNEIGSSDADAGAWGEGRRAATEVGELGLPIFEALHADDALHADFSQSMSALQWRVGAFNQQDYDRPQSSFVQLADPNSLSDAPNELRRSNRAMENTASAPKLLLHIGPWKTGTTEFQDVLSECAKKGKYAWWPAIEGQAIEGQALCEYACSLNRVDPEQRADCMSGIANFNAKLETYLKSPHEFVVLSSEFFANLTDEATNANMSSVLAPYNVTVVFVYRNGVSLALSLYNQRMKSIRVGAPFHEAFIDYRIIDWINPNFLDCSVIDRFRSAFGDDHVIVIDYDGLAASKADWANSILMSAGFPQIPVSCQSESGHANPSEDLDDGLLVYVFAIFAKRVNNCTLSEQVGAQHLGHLKTFSLPKRCYSMEKTVDAARKRDKECREQYGRPFLFANETATSLAMLEKLPYCELDADGMLRSAEWAERLQQQYDELRSVPNLCTEETGR